MRILISNDDGAHAPGIRTLANHLAQQGHDIFVCAPDRERSTTGHCLTLHKPLRAEEVGEAYAPEVKKAWRVNGTPCDSAKLGLNVLMDIKTLDLVLSGINRGPNMGTDVIYSGTVSAAVEGAIRSLPAIAVSLDSFDDKHYETAAKFTGRLLEQMDMRRFPSHTILNVNVPAVAYEELAGVRVTKLGMHRFRDVFEERQDLRGRTYYWQTGVVDDRETSPESDVVAVREKFVSLTPIHYDMTSYTLADTVSEWGIAL